MKTERRWVPGRRYQVLCQKLFELQQLKDPPEQVLDALMAEIQNMERERPFREFLKRLDPGVVDFRQGVGRAWAAAREGDLLSE